MDLSQHTVKCKKVVPFQYQVDSFTLLHLLISFPCLLLAFDSEKSKIFYIAARLLGCICEIQCFWFSSLHHSVPF